MSNRALLIAKRAILVATYPAFWPRAMRGDHPIAWARSVGRGRMFYTAIGHTASTFEDRNALKHIMGGIGWAAGF